MFNFQKLYILFGQGKMKMMKVMLIDVLYFLFFLETLNTQYFNSNILRFSYSSFLQPTIVYDYDMDNWRKRKVKETPISGKKILSEYFFKK